MDLLWTSLLALVALVAARDLPGSSINPTNNLRRSPKTFSLFSIVQFPNEVCQGASSQEYNGTCLTSTECTSKGGSADGNCAAGFGVCCVISTSTCGDTITTNTTYIQNPDFPTAYTPTATGSCQFKVNKISDDICQLRLDFQTMDGFALTGTTSACTDTLVVKGQTGVNPPTICGTNTGYHMYVEMGGSSNDYAEITITYAESTFTSKNFNILTRQIPCGVNYKAPTDCVQYFTGTSGTVNSYNFAGGHLLREQIYNNCIRTEAGMCNVRWCQTPTGSVDTFQMVATTAIAIAVDCGTINANGQVHIRDMTLDGVTHLPSTAGFTATAYLAASYDTQCGGEFGVHLGTTSQCLTSRSPSFMVGVWSTASAPDTATGFSLDFEQVPC